MTANEIVKALRECANTTNVVDECDRDDCVYNCELPNCIDKMMRDAADLIEQQRAEIERLKAEMPKWTDINDKMPDASENVLVANNRGKQWDIDKAWWNGLYFDRCGKRPLFHVTHWMPIPQPPEV